MTKAEIVKFSDTINMNELRNYRDEVGKKTRQILKGLTNKDVKRKFKKEQLDRILCEGGVTAHQKSIWLLDFWGKKNVEGILLMPVTRHQIVHINDCCKIKTKCSKKLG